MEIADVQDRKSLERYLDALPGDQRVAVARRIAIYAAARVLPVPARYFAENPDAKKPASTAAPVFGVLSVCITRLQGAIVLSGTALGAAASARSAARSAAASARAASSRSARSAFAALAGADASAAADAARSARSAASSADAAADAAAEMWKAIRADLTALQADPQAPLTGPWGAVPQSVSLRDDWAEACRLMRADKTADWSFWIAWYDRVLAGRNTLPEDMAKVLNPLRKEDWEKGPAHINPLFDEVLKKYREKDATGGGDVSSASYFDFIEVERRMRAVAFKGDHGAFESEDDRQDFLAALSDLRLDFEEWCELAREELQGRNHPVTAVKAVEMMLDQIGQIERGDPVSLRDLVRRGSRARRLARGEELEAALGPDLSQMLMESLDSYSETVRIHLGHILEVLDVLRQLDLDGVDSAEALATLKAGVARLFSQESDVLLPPDGKTRAIFDDMIAELEEEQAEIGEAKTEVARQQRGKRWAEKLGGVSATLRDYAEKGSEFANKAGSKIDKIKKWGGRWDTLSKILEWWDQLSSGGG